MKKILLSILFLCACAVMNAQSITLDGIYYTVFGGEAMVDDNTGYAGDGNVFIPATVEINGIIYDVVKIKTPGFQNNLNITSLAFAENSNLNVIDDYAFSNCSNLSGSINIPKSITTIGGHAFDMTGVTSLSFAENSQLEAIGHSAFDHCQNLGGQLVIPAKLTSIGKYAFEFTKITSLSSAENSELETIENSAFSNCYNLDFVVIPASVSSIGGFAFGACFHLITIVVLPETPPNLDGEAFSAIGTNTVYVNDVEAYQTWGGFTSVKSIGELVETIQDTVLNAIDQAKQGMELNADEEAIIQDYIDRITVSQNYIEILNLKIEALQYIALHNQRIAAINAINEAVQSMDLTTAETTIVNDYKTQILTSVSAQAIEAIKNEAIAFVGLHNERSSALQEIDQAMQAIAWNEVEINHLNIYITRIETAVTSNAIDDAKTAAIAYIGLHEKHEHYVSIISLTLEGEVLLPEEEVQLNRMIVEIYDAESEIEMEITLSEFIRYLSLHADRVRAITAIQTALQDETRPYFIELAQSFIDIIIAANDATIVNKAGEVALETLNVSVAAYEAAMTEIYSKLPTEGTSGPAVRISKQGKSDLILYNPDKVEFMKK